ncbi:CtIP-related endonuclease [Balamuthia mandrillaris]
MEAARREGRTDERRHQPPQGPYQRPNEDDAPAHEEEMVRSLFFALSKVALAFKQLPFDLLSYRWSVERAPAPPSTPASTSASFWSLSTTFAQVRRIYALEGVLRHPAFLLSQTLSPVESAIRSLLVPRLLSSSPLPPQTEAQHKGKRRSRGEAERADEPTWKQLWMERLPFCWWPQGVVSALLEAVLCFPLDVARARLSVQQPTLLSDRGGEPHLQYRYKGLLDCLWQSFFRPASTPATSLCIPSMLLSSFLSRLLSSLLSAFYDSKLRLYPLLNSSSSSSTSLYLPWETLKRSSSIALDLSLKRLLVMAATMPFQTVQRRLWSGHTSEYGRDYSGWLQCFTSILSQEGFSGFYKGALPEFCGFLLNEVLVFAVMEAVCAWLYRGVHYELPVVDVSDDDEEDEKEE